MRKCLAYAVATCPKWVNGHRCDRNHDHRGKHKCACGKKYG